MRSTPLLLAGLVLSVIVAGCATTEPRHVQHDAWDQTRAQAALQLADEQITAGRFDRARTLLAAHEADTNPRLQMSLARIDLEEGQYDAAARRLETMPPEARITPAYHEALGVAYEGLGQWDQAATEYEQAYELAPTAARLAAWLDTLVSAGHVEEAQQILESKRQRTPGEPAMELVAARLYARVNQPELTVRELQASLLRTPDSVMLKRRLAEALAAAGRHADALPLWRDLVRAATDGETRHTYRGELAACLLTLGQYAEATRTYRVMTLTQPEDAAAYIGLAAAALADGQPDEGIAAATRAVEIDSQSEDGRLALACGYAQRGQYGRAAEVLGTSVGGAGTEGDVREILARWEAQPLAGQGEPQ